MSKGFRSPRYAILVAAAIVFIAGFLGLYQLPQSAQKKKRADAPTTTAGSTSGGNSIGFSGSTINLPFGAFDPKAQIKDGGSATASATDLAPEGEAYYIVQFDTTANDQLLDSLRATGVEILQYVPNRAFFVYGKGASATEALGNSHVRWVGRLLPEYKISPLLTEQVEAAKEGRGARAGVSDLEMTGKGTSIFDVAVFKRADLKTVSAEIAAKVGGKIVDSIDLPGNFFNVVRVEAPVEQIMAAADIPDAFRIDAWGRPEKEDERAAQIVAGNYSSPTLIDPPGYDPLTQFGVNGSNVTVAVVDDGVGIPGDGGFYITSSNAVNGPLRGASSGANGHGHLNATIIAGDAPFSVLDPTGYNYGLGVSPKANIVNIPLLRSTYAGTEADTANDAVTTVGPNTVLGSISNNSWGNGTNNNLYDSYTAQFDGFVRDASAAASVDPLTMIFSAGNSGSSGLTRPKAAKNIIAVGNLENIRTELDPGANSIDDLNSSSSIGPAFDTRVKPDLAAPGTAITGGRSGSDALFGNIDSAHRWSSGTSHAAPQVAGAAALFTQFWKNGHGGANPSPALIKAALINGARDANGIGTGAAIPNSGEGWGRVYLKNVLNTGAAITYINEADTITGTGSNKIYNGSIPDSGRPVRVTLVWTDPPAVGDPALVNDLDLEVTAGGVTYRGNVLSGGLSIAGGSADKRNNVENVFLPAGVSGPISVRVLGSGINGDGVLGNADPTDQNFALVVFNGSVSIDTGAYLASGPLVLASGNGIIEPSECNLITIPFKNVGETTATGISATLSTTTPGVSVLVPNANYPDLAPGATGNNATSFAVGTDNTVACFTSIDLTLTVTYSGGSSPVVQNFSFPVGQQGSTNYNFVSTFGSTISVGGTLVPGSADDDVVVNFTAPFAFSVYGTSVAAGSTIRLGTNGHIRVETAGSAGAASTNSTLPATGSSAFPASLPVLMPYWDDLDMSPAVTTGGGIYSEVTGSPGSQTLKLEWRARHFVSGQTLGAPDTNFAVYFHENSNKFEYVYASTGAGVNALGHSATIGIQSATTGTIFTQFSVNAGSLSPGQMLSASIPQTICSAGTGACVFTAAPVVLAGRVLTTAGRGVPYARISLVDENSIIRTATTNSFGYFRFDSVPSGRTYVLSATAKGYSFESRVVDLNDNISDLNFIGSR